jgi:hypothetical protein
MTRTTRSSGAVRLFAAGCLGLAACALSAAPALGDNATDNGTIVVTGEAVPAWAQFFGASLILSDRPDPVTIIENRLHLSFPTDGGDVRGSFRLVTTDTYNLGDGSGPCTTHHLYTVTLRGTFTAATNTVHGTSNSTNTQRVLSGCGKTPRIRRFTSHSSWTGKLERDRFTIATRAGKANETLFQGTATAVAGTGKPRTTTPTTAKPAQSAVAAPATTRHRTSDNTAKNVAVVTAVVAAGALGTAAALRLLRRKPRGPQDPPKPSSDDNIADRNNPMADWFALQEIDTMMPW